MVANERRAYFLESACFNSCAFNSVTVKLTLRPLPSPNETRKAKYKAARAKTGRCGLLLVGQAADHLAKCLMLRSGIALPEEVSKLNRRVLHRTTRWHCEQRIRSLLRGIETSGRRLRCSKSLVLCLPFAVTSNLAQVTGAEFVPPDRKNPPA
jgi:hypothetical protein